jgi:hypothetical protein
MPKKDDYEDMRVSLYLWKKLDDIIRQYKHDLSKEEFVSIIADVQRDFKVRNDVSREESDLQFLNKVDNRIRDILRDREEL